MVNGLAVSLKYNRERRQLMFEMVLGKLVPPRRLEYSSIDNKHGQRSS